MQEVIRKGFNPFLETKKRSPRILNRERKMSVISHFNEFFSGLEYKNNFARSTKQELVKFLKGKNIEIEFEKFSEYLILFQNNYKFDITLKVDRHNGVTVYEVEKY
jgi:hypothetical protein